MELQNPPTLDVGYLSILRTTEATPCHPWQRWGRAGSQALLQCVKGVKLSTGAKDVSPWSSCWGAHPDKQRPWSTDKSVANRHLCWSYVQRNKEKYTKILFLSSFSTWPFSWNTHATLRFDLQTHSTLLAKNRTDPQSLFMGKHLKSISDPMPRSKWPWCTCSLQVRRGWRWEMVCSQLRDTVTELKSPIPCWYCQGENDKFLHLTVSPATESALSQTE